MRLLDRAILMLETHVLLIFQLHIARLGPYLSFLLVLPYTEQIDE